MKELVRIDILPYVSCLGDALNDEDPEFPVALALKDDVGNGVFRQVEATCSFVGWFLMIENAD